ncbi:flagellar hook-length control protein FliK [Nordella sp. HKS 07]|uniref:flagellar hook-length control protein FliK n=1 Tax=Nordella sp. HKS 07 TaxID=2712222 RepID=UPI0013E1CAFE|nr:flagellar hook-length control protein FliK [Nordella sp. HKS 07]QIG49898.1 flagellar hook-length control protein FliK [Nordella sp. HKS 07]
MMKAAAEQPAQIQGMPGQTGARQAPRARTGTDQLMADFDELLAKQSMISDMPPENREQASSDGPPAQQALASPEVLFLALTGGREFPAKQGVPEQPGVSDSGGDVSATASDDSATQGVTTMPEPIPVLAQSQVLDPPARIAVNEGRQPAIDKPAVGPSAPVPAHIELADTEAVADLTPELPASENDRAPARDGVALSVERKSQAIGEATSSKDMGASPACAPVTLIRVAGQETHFAPTPVFLFDDIKTGASSMHPTSGPDEPSGAQPQSPVALKAPSGPLKTLTVQLGSHELGLINATMALKDKALDLRVGAMRDEAVTSLRENAGRLTETLQSLGFSVDGVTVQKMHQVDAGAQTGSGQQMQHGAAGQDGQGQQRDPNASGFGAEGSSRQSRHIPDDDHRAEQDGNDQAKSMGGIRNSHDVFL